MMSRRFPTRLAARAGFVFLLLSFGSVSFAADPPKAAAKPAAKPAVKKPAPAKASAKAAHKPGTPLPPANTEQIEAAERVYIGHYECEFNQAIDIKYHEGQIGYVEVQFGKLNYLMKPVLSSTGAVRLEDMRAETLMVQIGTKSMLLNTKSGHRLVDECISPKQREAIEAAKQAKAAQAAAQSAQQQASAAQSAALAASAAAGQAAVAATAASTAAGSGLAAPAAPSLLSMPAPTLPTVPAAPAKPEVPKLDVPKLEAPKLEAPKIEAPKGLLQLPAVN